VSNDPIGFEQCLEFWSFGNNEEGVMTNLNRLFVALTFALRGATQEINDAIEGHQEA